jgi:hypothetical protein
MAGSSVGGLEMMTVIIVIILIVGLADPGHDVRVR